MRLHSARAAAIKRRAMVLPREIYVRASAAGHRQGRVLNPPLRDLAGSARRQCDGASQISGDAASSELILTALQRNLLPS
jgi:hypothetical protein